MELQSNQGISTHPAEVRQILNSNQVMEGDGFPVSRPFPVAGALQIDPFLLLDHFGPVNWPPHRAPGVPDHPHRGFEAITYLLQGQIIHRDSAGHMGLMQPGCVQYMTAGRGVVHSEMPDPGFKAQGGWMEGFQLWINLPAAKKMIPAQYTEIAAAHVPVIAFPGGSFKLIAGQAAGLQGPAQPQQPIHYRHYRLEPGATVQWEVDAGFVPWLYLLQGELAVGQPAVRLTKGQVAVFAPGGLVQAENQTQEPREFLALAGLPLNEPVARYGPFVMNSQLQIQEAVRDYQAGLMGQINN